MRGGTARNFFCRVVSTPDRKKISGLIRFEAGVIKKLEWTNAWINRF